MPVILAYYLKITMGSKMRFFLYLGFYVGLSLISARWLLAKEELITELKQMISLKAASEKLSFDKPQIKILAYARSPVSQDILYKEQHHILLKNGELFQTQTRYLDQHEKIIAQLVSDYSLNLKCPNYFFEDFRLKYNEGVKSVGELYLIFHKGKTKEMRRSKKDFFCGQGWHYYFMSHLQEIMKKTAKIKLILPGKFDYFTFKMSLVSQKQGVASFNLRLNSFLLRMFAPSMKLKYNLKSKRLQSYQGPSNLLDQEGKRPDVLICYEKTRCD